MTSSCSGALEIVIGTLSNAGQNILSPSPGFALFRCLLGAKQVEERLYKTLVSTCTILATVIVDVVTVFVK